MLLGGHAGQGLEPVGVVGRALGHRPVLHGIGDGIGDADIQLLALVDGFAQGPVHVRGERGAHDPVVKHQFAEHFRDLSHDRSFLSL